jgi:hypothetical protein
MEGHPSIQIDSTPLESAGRREEDEVKSNRKRL